MASSLLQRLQADVKPKDKQPKSAVVTTMEEAFDVYFNNKSRTGFKQKKGFAPSDTNKCARRMVYLLRGVHVVDTIDPRTRRVFDTGHSMHARFNDYFKEMGILKENELELWNISPPIHAFLDNIIDVDGEDIVVELKSIGDIGFENRLKYGKPKAEHIQQIQIYLHLTGIPRGLVIYENKNDQNVAIFEVVADPKAIEALFAKWRKTFKSFEDGELPKRPAKTPQSDICKYCELVDKCWSSSEPN